MKKIGIFTALLGLLLVGVLVTRRSRSPAPGPWRDSSPGESTLARAPAAGSYGHAEFRRPERTTAVSAPPPRFVAAAIAPADAGNEAQGAPVGRAPLAGAKDVYSALGLDAEQTQHAKDILRIQRERVLEVSASMRRGQVTTAQFQATMREIGRETDANLQSVLGEEKLSQWREYRKRRAEGEEAPKPISSE